MVLTQDRQFLERGESYGTPDYNSLVLLERYFEKYSEDADKVVLSIKGGMNPKTGRPDGSPDNTRRTLDMTDEEMAEIDATLAKFTTAGERYPAQAATNTDVDR
ncbi:Pyridoxal reductase [Talaromyces pinophilus]|nr:Pyridoxal reductase [Talaromyces pinophilus]